MKTPGKTLPVTAIVWPALSAAVVHTLDVDIFPERLILIYQITKPLPSDRLFFSLLIRQLSRQAEDLD